MGIFKQDGRSCHQRTTDIEDYFIVTFDIYSIFISLIYRVKQKNIYAYAINFSLVRKR